MNAFGDRLRELRHAADLSLTQLSRRANYDRSYISKLENGKATPSEDVARKFDLALGAGGALIRLVRNPPAEPEPEVLLPPLEPDSRPWSLIAEPSGRVSFSPNGAPVDGPDVVQFAPARLVVDEETVLVVEDAFDGLRRRGHRDSPAVVLPQLLLEWNRFHALTSVSRMPELVGLMSRWAEYTGWMHQEHGNPGQALWWTKEAARLSASVGDTGPASWALVRAAEIALYEGDALRMIDYARQAAELSRDNPVLRAQAALREAQGQALCLDPDAYQRCIDAARRWQELADRESGPHYGTTSLADPIAMTEGWSLYNLDRSDEAVALLTAQLAQIPAAAKRSRVRFGTRLALALADRGDVEAARDQAVALLKDLRRVDSATVRTDLHELRRLLMKRATDSATRDLNQDLLELSRIGR